MPQPTKVYCALCPDGAKAVWFADKKGLHQHLTQAHTGKTAYACAECGATGFKAPLDLQAHASAKHPMNIKCERAECPLLFSSQARCTSHARVVHPAPVPVPATAPVPASAPVPAPVPAPAPTPASAHKHVEEEDHTCALCGTPFPSAIAHVAHMKSSHAGAHHVCGLGGCARAFRTSAARQQHIADAHPRRATCGVCGVPFVGPEVREGHVRARHPSAPPLAPSTPPPPPPQQQQKAAPVVRVDTRVEPAFKCDECGPSGKTLGTAAALAQHKSAEHRFACDACTVVLSSSVALAQHTVDAHRVLCAHCGLYLRNDNELRAHRKAKHLRFECMSCRGADFASAGELTAHLEATHYVRCAQCGQTFVSREEMELHVDLVHSFPCALCEAYFETEAELAEHGERAHDAERYPCDRCAEKFGSQADLDAHVGREHPPPLPMFSCGFCELRFATLQQAEEHGYAAHTCVTCLKTGFRSRDALEEHVGEHRYPFRCGVCGTRYTEEEELSEHFRRVPDVHPVCPRCGLGFEADGDLAMHVESFHPRIPCEVCDGEVFEAEDLPRHWVTSSKHPTCFRCSEGFPSHQAFIEHGSYQHPDMHCILCHFQFDTVEGLENHVKHFSKHPQCEVCGERFPDEEMLHHHLVKGHRQPSLEPDHVRRSSWPESVAATSTAHEDTPFTTAPATPPQVRRISLSIKQDSPSYAAVVPLPASVSRASSPRSFRRASLTSSGTRASIGGVASPLRRGSPLAREQGRRLSLSGLADSAVMNIAASSPLSNVADIATPIPERRFSAASYGARSNPFNPENRPETPPGYFDSPRRVSSSPRRIDSTNTSVSSVSSRRVPRLVIDDDHSTSSDESGSPVSPELTSPSVGLPEIEHVAPTPTSDGGWSVPSRTRSSSKLSSPTLTSAAPASNVAQTQMHKTSAFYSPQDSSAQGSTDVTRITMPSLSQIKVPYSSPGRPPRSFMLPSQSYLTVPRRFTRPSSVSITPSSISPQSAGIPLSGMSPGGGMTPVTPDFVREARAYLAITNGPETRMRMQDGAEHSEAPSAPRTPPPRTQTPPMPLSSGLSSPYVGEDSYGYLNGGQRREVHFEERLVDERWDASQSYSQSSGVPSPTSALRSPINIQLSRVNGKTNGSSKLPRWTPPKNGWKASNGWTYDSYRVDHVGSPRHEVENESPARSKFICRLCSQDAGDKLTATMCGHLFCNP
ncbi:hypothetical protein CONPUDRAFT_157324 [Coniophora puteana RWD-64-598 SS2]|uniref:C2H2-type domain-containing protein n=1 Tax=Coniophora puteana (strain RWD-64-598) TaxID=741705 RepID=A0A5M3MCS2_CONPW|nr:uncharacterized protein CONPUDRAFT_157324 [Coniophora puteana RWD-64-598 SS2]EIW77052.1 hypothetical protein CONPUDRAFT_157324 [Coniophora puteana RWD-64-598 SS2]